MNLLTLHIVQEDFDPSPLLQIVFDMILEQVTKLDGLDNTWRKAPIFVTRQKCSYSRTYKRVSVFENGADFTCQMCKQYDRFASS